jgi:hypothetical protein
VDNAQFWGTPRIARVASGYQLDERSRGVGRGVVGEEDGAEGAVINQGFEFR